MYNGLFETVQQMIGSIIVSNSASNTVFNSAITSKLSFDILLG